MRYILPWRDVREFESDSYFFKEKCLVDFKVVWVVHPVVKNKKVLKINCTMWEFWEQFQNVVLKIRYMVSFILYH